MHSTADALPSDSPTPTPAPLTVSVIATVYNEHTSIERLLDSLAAQTRRPDEVVICDGGSHGRHGRVRRRVRCPQPPGCPTCA